MKGKVTSLILVGGAFLVAALTQDSSSHLQIGSRALNAFIVIAWFGVMGTSLYFWSKHTRRKVTQQPNLLPEESGNFSLRQLAQAIGSVKRVSVTETSENTENTPLPSVVQKNRI